MLDCGYFWWVHFITKATFAVIYDCFYLALGQVGVHTKKVNFHKQSLCLYGFSIVASLANWKEGEKNFDPLSTALRHFPLSSRSKRIRCDSNKSTSTDQ